MQEKKITESSVSEFNLKNIICMVQDPQAREKGMITQKTKHIYETHLQEALKRRAQDPSSKTKDYM